MAVRQERQDGSCDHCKARKGLDVLVVEPVDETVHLTLESEQERYQRSTDDRQRRIAVPGEKAEPDRDDRSDGAGRLRPLIDVGSMSVPDRDDRGGAGNERSGGQRLARTSNQPRYS